MTDASEGVVRIVKPLEWRDAGCGIWTAAANDIALMWAQVSFEAEGVFELDLFVNDEDDAPFPSLEAAKAAAQADYEARIKSALTPEALAALSAPREPSVGEMAEGEKRRLEIENLGEPDEAVMLVGAADGTRLRVYNQAGYDFTEVRLRDLLAALAQEKNDG